MTRRQLAMGGLIVAALVARVAVRDFETFDSRSWVAYWYQYLYDHGVAALGGELPNDEGFSQTLGNYPPPYYYFLFLVTWFDDLLPRLYLIKLISVAFDVVAAVFNFLIVRHVSGSQTRGVLCGALTFAAPTLVLNGALWGQCDSIHTSLMLGSVYLSIAGRPLATMVLLGVALSFKAQPVFLLPYIAMLTFGGRMPYRYWIVLPATYAVMMMPAVLLGRTYADLFLIYVHQGGFFHHLSMMSPNLYYFISDAYYVVGTRVGVVVTIVASLAFAVWPRKKLEVTTSQLLLLAATASVAMAPFFLPKMHDRYFLPADLLSIALACSMPRFWLVAVGFQISSTIAYLPVITASLNEGAEYTDLMPLAAVINTALVAALLIAYVRQPRRSERLEAEAGPA